MCKSVIYNRGFWIIIKLIREWINQSGLAPGLPLPQQFMCSAQDQAHHLLHTTSPLTKNLAMVSPKHFSFSFSLPNKGQQQQQNSFHSILVAALQASTCSLKLEPHPFLERHTAALFQAMQTHLRISSSIPVFHCKSHQAHGDSKALSIPHNLPGVQNTEAIGTLMSLRTLTQASATKPIWFSCHWAHDTAGKLFVYFLRRQEVVLKENSLQMTSEFNMSDKNKTQKCSTQTPHQCPPSKTPQVTKAVPRQLVGTNASSTKGVKGKAAQLQGVNTTGFDRTLPGGKKKHHIRLWHQEKSVPSSLELWRGFPVCGTRVSPAQSCSWHPVRIPNSCADKHLCNQVLPLFTKCPQHRLTGTKARARILFILRCHY